MSATKINEFSDKSLDISNFYMRYPGKSPWLIRDLNFSISSGEKVALIGASGSGKSTIAKIILQLLPSGSLCEGDLTINGLDPRTLNLLNISKFRGETVGLIFQDPMKRLNPLMSIGDHIINTIMAHQKPKNYLSAKNEAIDLLVKVGISLKRFNAHPYELSGGMRQRVAIALAICLKPSLIIADEPTTSLDKLIANQIMAELTNMCDIMGSSLLLISHDLAMASRWVDRIAILDNGKIIEDNNVKKILLNPISETGKKLIDTVKSKEKYVMPSTSNHELILEVSGLRCWFSLPGLPWQLNWLRVLDEVSFKLHSGETLGVLGESGSGKSSLCRALMGLIPIRGGNVTLDGSNILRMRGKKLRIARQNLQMVFQDPFASLNPNMNVQEAILDPILMHNLLDKYNAKRKVFELLEQVNLKPAEDFIHCYPKTLSGGQQQRVAIARALALKPKVLICDESVSMLDAETQYEILSLLRSLQKRLGLAIVFVTHDLTTVKNFCQKIIVLDKGKIVEEGIPSKVFDKPQSSVIKKLLDVLPSIDFGD